jgi:hypothetical protein
MGKDRGDAPKRPRSGYILFTMDKREDVKASNPGIANKEIMKKLAEEWKALSDKEKKVYNDRASKEKENYKAQKPSSGKKDKKGGKKEKKPTKKAPSSDEEDEDDS